MSIPKYYRIVCTGGRNYQDRDKVHEIMNGHLEAATQQGRTLRVGVGDADGLDKLIYLWAEEKGVDVTRYVAEWKHYGLRAGPLRNERMLNMEKPDLVLQFPGGKGTAHCVSAALDRLIPVLVVKL